MERGCTFPQNGTCGAVARFPVYSDHLASRVLHAFIAVTAFSSNLLLCIVLLKGRKMLKKPYNILIFNLAITDLLTGFFVGLSPRFVILQRSFPAPRGIWGEIFCRTWNNHFFIVVFGKASNVTLMCLSLERWFAFVRPIQHKVAFTKPRMLKFLAVIWCFSIFGKVYALFEKKVSNGRCVRNQKLDRESLRLLAVIHVLVTFGLPVAVTWGTFAHLWKKMKTSVAAEVTHQGRARIRLLRMCAVTALFLTLCWFPSECVFVLVNFNMLGGQSNWRLITFMLAVFNSCLNPWVYYLTNREYKRQFVSVLCFWRKHREARPAVISRARVLRDRVPQDHVPRGSRAPRITSGWKTEQILDG